MAVEGREVWNTYGPTEATVVACAARLAADEPVRIGLPLNGWELAVVDEAGAAGADGRHRGAGHRRRRAGPLPGQGQGRREVQRAAVARLAAGLPQRRHRARRAGGPVVRRPRRRAGQARRPPDRTGRGGRGPAGAARGSPVRACAVQRTKAGNQILVGYVVPVEGAHRSTTTRRSRGCASSCRPRSCRCSRSSTTCRRVRPARSTGPRCRGRCRASSARQPRRRHRRLRAHADRGVAGRAVVGDPRHRGRVAGRRLLQQRRRQPDRGPADRPGPDTGARRSRSSTSTRSRSCATSPRSSTRYGGGPTARRDVAPVPARVGLIQTALMLPLWTLVGLRWAVVAADPRATCSTCGALPQRVVVVARGRLAGAVQPGRPDGDVGGRGPRCCCATSGPARYPRGGGVHLRLWFASSWPTSSAPPRCPAPAFMTQYAKWLGAKVGKDVDLHSAPPVTGMLKVGNGAAVEPEVDLSGFWVDGDRRPRRQGPDRCRRAHRHPQHAAARAPGSARTPCSNPARCSPAWSATASAGAVHRPTRSTPTTRRSPGRTAGRRARTLVVDVRRSARCCWAWCRSCR